MPLINGKKLLGRSLHPKVQTTPPKKLQHFGEGGFTIYGGGRGVAVPFSCSGAPRVQTAPSASSCAPRGAICTPERQVYTSRVQTAPTGCKSHPRARALIYTTYTQGRHLQRYRLHESCADYTLKAQTARP